MQEYPRAYLVLLNMPASAKRGVSVKTLLSNIGRDVRTIYEEGRTSAFVLHSSLSLRVMQGRLKDAFLPGDIVMMTEINGPILSLGNAATGTMETR